MKRRIFIGLLCFQCLSLVVLSGCNHQHDDNKEITIVFRYDDYAENRPIEFKSDIINTFAKYNIPFTSAVIPFVQVQDTVLNKMVNLPLSLEKSRVLTKAYNNGYMRIAQHGFNHRDNSNNGTKSEFTGLSYDEQYQKIKMGKDHLEQLLGIKIQSFVPPYNTYDKATVEVLEDLGFTVVSGDILLGETVPASSLKVVPNTTTLKNFKEAIEIAFKSPEKNPLVVCMMHGYDFIEDDPEKGFITLKDLDTTLEWVNQQESIRTLSFHESSRSFPDIGMIRYDQNKKVLNILFKLPPVVKHGFDSYYYGVASYKKYLKLFIGFYLLLFSIILLMAYMFIKGFKLDVQKLKVLTISTIMIVAAVLLYALFKSHFGYKIVATEVVLFGLLAALLIQLINKRKVPITGKSSQ